MLPITPTQPIVPQRAANSRAVYGYLCFSHIPTPETIFEGVSTATPFANEKNCNSALRFEFKVNEVAHDAHAPESRSGEDDTLELDFRLYAAFARSMEGVNTDAGVGVFLSGGLDSSLVAAFLVRQGLQPHCFTLDFGAPFNSELLSAKLVAEHLQLPLTVVPCHGMDVLHAINPTADALPQPFGDAVTIPLYLLGKAASDHVGSVFNGEGGDQLFGGWANKPIIASQLYGGSATSLEQEYLATYHRFWGEEERWLTHHALRAIGKVDPADWIRDALHPPGIHTLIHRLRAANIALKGAQNIVPRMLSLAQCHGLELRAPLFDPELAAWTFGLAPERLLNASCEKYLLKRVAEKYLPSEIVWQPKRGMGVPITEWCLGPLRREIRRRLSPSRLKRDGWFQAEPVLELINGRDPSQDFRRRRLGEKLWALYHLHTWLDRHEMHLLPE